MSGFIPLRLSDRCRGTVSELLSPQLDHEIELKSVSREFQILFDLRPRYPRLLAVRFLGPLDDTCVFDVFDGLAQLAKQSFGLDNLLV